MRIHRGGEGQLTFMDYGEPLRIDGIFIRSGASLKLYVSAPTASISGKGIVKDNADPNSFYYLGLPTNTKLSLSGNSQFTGADGGTEVYDFVGSSVTRSVVLNGHYNERLDQNGPMRVLVVTSWNEI
jgi:hypothetical protein